MRSRNQFATRRLVIRIRALLVALLASALVGCPPTIDLDTLPSLEGPSPLRSIGPLTMIVHQFKDPTPRDPSVPIERKPGELVTDVIAAELVRNGYRLVTNEVSEKPDAILNGYVTACHVLLYWGSFESKLEAKVAANIELINKEGRQVFSKDYSGTTEPMPCVRCYPGHPFLPLGDRALYARELLKRSLLNLVRDITTDPEFLDMLREISAKQKH
jgi:hypothetical protein